MQPNQVVRGPNWLEPALISERDKFENVANRFGLDMAAFINAANRGQLVELPFTIWSKLENSNSYTYKAAVDDTTGIKHAFMVGAGLPAPIVWQRNDEQYYLITGNTRLAMARSLNVRPKVFLFGF